MDEVKNLEKKVKKGNKFWKGKIIPIVFSLYALFEIGYTLRKDSTNSLEYRTKEEMKNYAEVLDVERSERDIEGDGSTDYELKITGKNKDGEEITELFYFIDCGNGKFAPPYQAGKINK